VPSKDGVTGLGDAVISTNYGEVKRWRKEKSSAVSISRAEDFSFALLRHPRAALSK